MTRDVKEVMDTLEEYADAYCSKDVDRLMALFIDGDDISLIGTGADEICSGRLEIAAVFRRNFHDATATLFDWHWKHISVVGDAATAAITLTIHLNTDDGNIQVPIRWTVSLVRLSGKWCWMHRHASSAATSQKDGTAYPSSDSEA